MNHHDLHAVQPGEQTSPPFWKSPTGVVVIMLALIAVFYMLREHWAHVVGNWAYLLLLLCPLMHVFGHGGHGGHSHRQGSETPPDRKDN